MFQINHIFFLCSALTVATCLSTPLKKCNILDGKCKIQMFQQYYNTAVGDSSLDPLELGPLQYNFSESATIKFGDVEVTGFKSCSINALQTERVKDLYVTKVNATCSIKLKSDFDIDLSKALMEELGSTDVDADVTGSGSGEIIIDNLNLSGTISFNVVSQGFLAFLRLKSLEFGYSADSMKTIINSLDVGNEANAEKIKAYLEGKTDSFKLVDTLILQLNKILKAFFENVIEKIPVNNLYSGDIQTDTSASLTV